MPEEKSLGRLRKVGKYASWLLGIVIAVLLVFLVGGIACTVWLALDDGASLDPMGHDESLMRTAETVVNTFFELLICFVAYRTFRSMLLSHSPFIGENVERIRGIALISVIAFAVTLVVGIVLHEALCPEEAWLDVRLQYLVLAAVSYVFALLFEYGSALQTESDEFL